MRIGSVFRTKPVYLSVKETACEKMQETKMKKERKKAKGKEI